MERMDRDLCSMLRKRVYDIAGIVSGVKVYLNNEHVKVKNFVDYVKLYVKGVDNDCGNGGEEGGDMPKKRVIAHEKVDRWEVCCTHSEGQFQQVRQLTYEKIGRVLGFFYFLY